MQGSYKYAIEMRSKGTIEKLKRYHQREKDRAAKKGRAMNWFNKLWTVVVYLIVIFGLMALLLPSIAMNYIKSQVKTGEWGGDFKAEDFINRYNYTAPVEQKEEDEDFGDDADGSWKPDEEKADNQEESAEDEG